MKVIALWLSRHSMSIAQEDDFKKTLGQMFGQEPHVAKMNVTFPAKGFEAFDMLCDIVEHHKHNEPATVVVLAGVFPAHIAAHIARDGLCDYSGQPYPRMPASTLKMVPVSMPAAATEGETRGFVHSHWEFI